MPYRKVLGCLRVAQAAVRAAGLAGALVLIAVPQAAVASDLRAFNDAFADAWSHYRQAVFYGRTGNVAVATLELDNFAGKWSELMARFGPAPPDAFADDRAWAETLDSIGAAAQKALAQFDAGEAEEAAQTLAPLREIAAALRRRNNVTVYADTIDELSAAMDVLARYRRDVKDLDDAAAVDRVTRQAAVVAYLFDKCDLRAADPVRDDPEFRRLIDGARDSMDKLWSALRTGDIRLYRIGIGELRSYERILVLRFG